MKRLVILSVFMLSAIQCVLSQPMKMAEEGTPYYLPRTTLHFTVRVEKTTYTPGEFAVYAEKYMKMRDVQMQSEVKYRVLSIKMDAAGDRDTSKLYVAPTDLKHSIQTLGIDENGCLNAVNADAAQPKRATLFKPAPRPAQLNPRDYMNEDILSAGSTAKMAELCALEIYDIRDSKSTLSKGQAEYMPKDGEQLRIMLDNLNTQERALMQLFNGVTVKDTTETVIDFIPEKTVERQPLFRFSAWNGIVDADDLSGTPYYISVTDMQSMASVQEIYLNMKGAKDNGGIYVNMPGKMKVTLSRGNNTVIDNELYAGQFGKTVMLNDMLFGKKFSTILLLSPVTGGIEQIKADPVKK